MQPPEKSLLVSGEQMTNFLSLLQSETAHKLSVNPLKAKQQLNLALYGLSRFVHEAQQYRNQLLGRALDPTQKQPEALSIIDMTPLAIEKVFSQHLNLSEMPIAGWDFLATTETSPVNGQPVFEQEFVERTVYLLSELAYDEPQPDATSALLSVDRLDLLLTLAHAEAKRIFNQLQDYGA